MALVDLCKARVMESELDNEVCATISNEDMAQLIALEMADLYGEEGCRELLETNVPTMESAMVDVMERTIVKLDKKAKKNRAYKMNILQAAREKNDPDVKKLETLWNMERFLWRRMEKRHMAEAKARTRTVAKKTADSPIAKIKKAGASMMSKLTHSEAETAKAKKFGGKPISGELKSKSNSVMKQLAAKVK